MTIFKSCSATSIKGDRVTSDPTSSVASESAEAGLIPPMTQNWQSYTVQSTMSRGHMQSFNLLALKLWICIDPKRKYRQLYGLEKYIVRFNILSILKIKYRTYWKKCFFNDQFNDWLQKYRIVTRSGFYLFFKLTRFRDDLKLLALKFKF